MKQPQTFDSAEPACPSPGNMDPTHPDLALCFRGDRFWVSYDCGQNWSSPYQIPNLGQVDALPRTESVVSNANRCQTFLQRAKWPGRGARSRLRPERWPRL